MVYDGEYSWSDSIPRDAWHLSGRPKPSRCLDTLLRIDHLQLPSPPSSQVAAMATVMSDPSTPVPWHHILPRSDYRKFFKNTMEVITSNLDELSYDYYESTWGAGSRLLASLRGSKVDLPAWAALSEAGGISGLESFKPGRTGYAAVPTYDRFATRTGRLTITSGPNLLILRKDARSILRSVFPDGIICSLDFRALEARIVLAETGRVPADGDMYDSISQELFDGEVDRSIVKTAVLGELYGAGRASLAARLRVPDDKLDTFVSRIRDHFGIEELADRLRKRLNAEGKVRSKFGRPHLVDDDARDAILVNTFAQSTGVDVSLQGFDTILQMLGPDGIRPLFVLHDAIILDVRGDRVSDVKNCTSVSIPTYEHKFSLKYDKIV
jgi:hypothetical protein